MDKRVCCFNLQRVTLTSPQNPKVGLLNLPFSVYVKYSSMADDKKENASGENNSDPCSTPSCVELYVF